MFCCTDNLYSQRIYNGKHTNRRRNAQENLTKKASLCSIERGLSNALTETGICTFIMVICFITEVLSVLFDAGVLSLFSLLTDFVII